MSVIIRKARNKVQRATEAEPFGQRPCARSAVLIVAQVDLPQLAPRALRPITQVHCAAAW